MRILFISSGGYGHFLPLVPLAEALTACGHDIAFAVPASFGPVVEKAGFQLFPLEEDEPRSSGGSASALQTPSDHSKAAVVRYLDQAVSHTSQLTAIARDWRPDALVRETTAWAGWLVGDILDLPVAVFDFEPTPPLLLAMTLGPEFQAARVAVGLPPDTRLRSMNHWLHLLGAPPGWFPESAFGRTSHLFQPPEDPAADHLDEPAWSFASGRERPLVYVSLGTKFNRTRGAFETVFEALADEAVEVLATIGPGMDPGSFGELPSNVTVERFIPQGLVVPHADVVICHGGYGSVMSALRAGKPVIARPLGNADGPANARRVEALGVGKAITDSEVGADRVRDAVRFVLNDPRVQSTAAQVAAATRALPPLTEAATLIEKLAASRTPVYGAVRAAR